ncbi:MAG: carboxyl transferase [Lachnospiraceae bacterium]|nr:carboxyl transferase [Lachnospiraceae bacterium]
MSEQTKALARIEGLADEGSFVEIGAYVTARETDFSLSEKKEAGDGVVTGYATIERKLVFVYSQDAAVLGGSLGEMHAKKIIRLYEMAMKMGAPIIGLIDCAGVRLEESTDGLYAFGELFKVQAKASGIVPEIQIVFGKCGGGMALSAGVADFVFMEEKNAALFVNAPNTLDGNYKEKINTASAAYQAANTGLVDGAGTEDEVLEAVRSLVAILPSNNEEPAVQETQDDLNRLTGQLEGVKDVKEIISVVADYGQFVEVKKEYGKDVTAGFIRLDGITVGVVGNAEEKISAAGCEKTAAFVTFCDAFEIPVLTLTGVTGFASEIEEEKNMAKAASLMTYAFANTTVPRIGVVVADSYGSAYTAMNSKAIGCDIVYALEGVKIGLMDAGMAAKILAKDAKDIPEVRAAFDEKQTAEASARRGYIDEIVSASTLRKNILIALEMLFNKREEAPYKKHAAK